MYPMSETTYETQWLLFYLDKALQKAVGEYTFQLLFIGSTFSRAHWELFFCPSAFRIQS